MELLLIRHGQTAANVTGALDTTHPGFSLNPLGRRQADAVVDALSDEPVGALYTSPLVRTRQTAAPLAAARQLSPATLPGLREIDAGDLEMRNDPAALRSFLGVVNAWVRGHLKSSLPSGTSGHDFLARFDQAITMVERTCGGSSAVVFSHDGALRVWVARRAIDVDPEHAVENALRNTGSIRLVGSSHDGWRVSEWSTEPLGGRDLLDDRALDPTGARPGPCPRYRFAPVRGAQERRESST